MNSIAGPLIHALECPYEPGRDSIGPPDAGHDGWLFYDHHHRDPIGERILGLDPKAHITRRWYYYIPATANRAS